MRLQTGYVWQVQAPQSSKWGCNQSWDKAHCQQSVRSSQAALLEAAGLLCNAWHDVNRYLVWRSLPRAGRRSMCEVYDIAGRCQVSSYTLPCHRPACWSPDSAFICSLPVTPGPASAWAAAFARTAGWMFGSSDDAESLHVHRASNGELVASLHLPCFGAVSNVHWHPSCTFLIVEHMDRGQHVVSCVHLAPARTS